MIIFIDEPILTALGTSSYISVSQEEAMHMIRQTVETIKAEGALSGLHCCGRADWKEVLTTGVDILNFDAYGFFDSLLAAGESIEGFLSKGGVLAWGIVPTTEAINSENKDTLLKRLEEYMEKLGSFISKETILNSSIITPSCGAGSRTVAEAERVFSVLHQMGEALR
ncbi:MAG: hypothetical protein D6778_09940 [Nitrospirae bacterium]|nr:MAG: hypothetical protein D6778_09940 [Nitrospirota bacterium]